MRIREDDDTSQENNVIHCMVHLGCHDNGKSYRFGETITRKENCEKW